MQNGWQLMQNYVLGVKKLSKEAPVVILWLVSAVKVFAIYAQNHGSQIIKIILNVTSTKKVHSKM
jgi:hypothetical protein